MLLGCYWFQHEKSKVHAVKMTVEWLFSSHLALSLWGWDAGQVLTRKWTQDAVSSLKDETTQERNQNEDDTQSDPDLAAMQTLPMYGWVHIFLTLPMILLYFTLMAVLDVPMYSEEPGLTTSICKTFALPPTALHSDGSFSLNVSLEKSSYEHFFSLFLSCYFPPKYLVLFLTMLLIIWSSLRPSMCTTCLQFSVLHINEYWMVSWRYFIELCLWFLQNFF